MRWGNENGLKVGVAGALATVALSMIVRLIAGSHMPSPPAVTGNDTRDRRNEFRAKKRTNLFSVPRSGRLELNENTEYEGRGRNLFRFDIPVVRARSRSPF